MMTDPRTRHHAQVPTECSTCGSADFSSVVEVTSAQLPVLHWVAPPSGWYLLREARPTRGTPIVYARCPVCMLRLIGAALKHPLDG